MRTVSSIKLKQLDGMSLHEIIDFVEDQGYSTEAMSNDEIYDMAISVLDGHEDDGAEPEDLDFTMDFKQDAYHGD